MEKNSYLSIQHYYSVDHTGPNSWGHKFKSQLGTLLLDESKRGDKTVWWWKKEGQVPPLSHSLALIKMTSMKE